MEMPVDAVSLYILVGFSLAVCLIIFLERLSLRKIGRLAKETERREREAKKAIQKQIRGE